MKLWGKSGPRSFRVTILFYSFFEKFVKICIMHLNQLALFILMNSEHVKPFFFTIIGEILIQNCWVLNFKDGFSIRNFEYGLLKTCYFWIIFLKIWRKFYLLEPFGHLFETQHSFSTNNLNTNLDWRAWSRKIGSEMFPNFKHKKLRNLRFNQSHSKNSVNTWDFC